ncbi:DUF2459 domain-containing protein [Sulfitobacter sp. LCG007]
MLALPCAYVIAAFVGAAIPSGGTASPLDRAHEVLLIHGPIHYDFLVPLDGTTRARFAPLASSGLQLDHPEAEWLVIGWGGRTFYREVPSYAEVTFRAVWRSVLGDASLLRVGLAGRLPDAFDARTLWMSDAEYHAFLAALTDSLAPESPADPPVPGYDAFDYFYPAEGRFHLGRTCNAWVGEMIRASGLRFGVWTPLTGSVSLSHWLYQER